MKKWIALYGLLLLSSHSSMLANAELPYKPTLPFVLEGEKTLQDSSTLVADGFVCKSHFSVDMRVTFAPSNRATLRLKAVDANGRGMDWQLGNETLSDGPTVLADGLSVNDGQEHTFRSILDEDRTLLYRDDSLLVSAPALQLGFPVADSLFEEPDADSTGIYNRRNLIRNPGFETEGRVINNSSANYQFWPANWEISGADRIEDQSGTCVRCNKNNATYANGREGTSALMFRQDGGGGFSAANGSYIYQKLQAPLQAGRQYRLAFQALSHTNDLGKSYAVAVGSALGQWDALYQIWTAPNVKQTLANYSYTFTAPRSGDYWVAILCYGASGIVHLDRMTLAETKGEYNLLKVEVCGESPADMVLGGISYAGYAFSPVSHYTNRLYDGGEFYLYNTYYQRALGSNEAGNVPALSDSGTHADEDRYVWIAEADEATESYRLKQKSSGLYLATSTANTWSMTFSSAVATDQTQLWKATEGTAGTILSVYSNKYLGCDSGAETAEYINVYYDKAVGALSQWQVVEATSGLEAGRLALYLSELEEAIRLGEQMIASQIYSAVSVATVSAVLEEGRALGKRATAMDLAEIAETRGRILSAVQSCELADKSEVVEAVTWITEKTASLGSSYTLDLTGVQFEGSDANVLVLLRNKEKRGALIGLSAAKVLAGGQCLGEYAVDTVRQHVFRFCHKEGVLTIWRDSLVVGTVPTYPVPAITSAGEESEYSLFNAKALKAYGAELVSEKTSLAPGTNACNSQGKEVRRLLAAVNQHLVLDRPVDLYISSSENVLNHSTLELKQEDAWIILEHLRPSAALSTLFPSLLVNGAKASNNKNVRVAIYLDGCAVIPHGEGYQPFRGYSGEGFTGDETSLGVGNNNRLGLAANTFQSFVLKRGYMVTLATDADGGGYSRVYVADHKDLRIPVIPEALNRRISSVHLKKWNYVSKKGWAGTSGTGTIQTEANTVRANWFYTWGADRKNTTDLEYVPIKQHLWWPGWNQINALDDCTHLLGYNEPEHAEQHTSSICSCSGAISEWNAFTHHTEFFESGMRIGSPSPTDAGYLTNYITYCNNYAYRCDFVVTHAYWKYDVSTWKSNLEAIHKATGRPIWITEMENGASWDVPGETNVTSAAEKYKKIFDLLESLDYVERYMPYNMDLWYNRMIYKEGGLTPAGVIFRDYPSSFAYKAEAQFIPFWWKPSLKEISMTLEYLPDNRLVNGTVNNPNGDVTDRLVIQYRQAEENWTDLCEIDDRSAFDRNAQTILVDVSALPFGTTQFRARLTTLIGGETYSPEVGCNLTDTGITEETVSGTPKTTYYTLDGVETSSCGNGFFIEKTLTGEGNVHYRKRFAKDGIIR